MSKFLVFLAEIDALEEEKKEKEVTYDTKLNRLNEEKKELIAKLTASRTVCLCLFLYPSSSTSSSFLVSFRRRTRNRVHQRAPRRKKKRNQRIRNPR